MIFKQQSISARLVERNLFENKLPWSVLQLGILDYSVLEIGAVSVFRPKGGQENIQLDPLERSHFSH
jgi:hypothetical protein